MVDYVAQSRILGLRRKTVQTMRRVEAGAVDAVIYVEQKQLSRRQLDLHVPMALLQVLGHHGCVARAVGIYARRSQGSCR